jgi:GAF domain-containing protein
MTEPLPPDLTAELDELRVRVLALERERQTLLAVIEILQEISANLHIVDILQSVTRKLGETFGLDRCSILLAKPGERTARLVASYEDPLLRNYLVDLERYPELTRALQLGETVYIPDVSTNPDLQDVVGVLLSRRVQSITAVPIPWRGSAVGVIFLRSFRGGPPFSDAEVKFVQVVASLLARALRNAHRYERLLSRRASLATEVRREDLSRVALVGALRRLLDAYDDQQDVAERRLPPEVAKGLEELAQAARDALSGVDRTT